MGRVKEIIVKPISSSDASKLCKMWHYSGKVAAISQVHFGAFLDGKCQGIMQFGPPIDRRKLLPLVKGTKFYDFLELNRMAFSDTLPKNSESRCISIALRMIKKNYPNIKWVVSFADATQCGDGTIYRATNFVLTQIKRNTTISITKSGEIFASHGSKKRSGKSKPLPGFQLRYIYFIDKSYRKNLTVKEIPFSKIKELGASMYLGKPIKHSSDAADNLSVEGGVIPTDRLQTSELIDS